MKQTNRDNLKRLCHCRACGATWLIAPKDLRKASYWESRTGNYYEMACKLCHKREIRWYLYG